MQTQLIIAGSTGRGWVIPILSVAASLSEGFCQGSQKTLLEVQAVVALLWVGEFVQHDYWAPVVHPQLTQPPSYPYTPSPPA